MTSLVIAAIIEAPMQPPNVSCENVSCDNVSDEHPAYGMPYHIPHKNRVVLQLL
jgi:hypothetical protein